MKRVVVVLACWLGAVQSNAAEVVILISNRWFNAKVPDDFDVNSVTNQSEIIDLLKASEIHEIRFDEKGIKSDRFNRNPWTEVESRNPWTEVMKGRPWTETQKAGPWTEINGLEKKVNIEESKQEK